MRNSLDYIFGTIRIHQLSAKIKLPENQKAEEPQPPDRDSSAFSLQALALQSCWELTLTQGYWGNSPGPWLHRCAAPPYLCSFIPNEMGVTAASIHE